jgi:hypothetical protein
MVAPSHIHISRKAARRRFILDGLIDMVAYNGARGADMTLYNVIMLHSTKLLGQTIKLVLLPVGTEKKA